MRYFSGFSLRNEEKLFEDILDTRDFCVSGFSYGAIKAVLYSIKCNTRIDKLQLISPAFFQTNDEKFKRMQLIYFKKNKQKYINNFCMNSVYPKNINLDNYLVDSDIEELKDLLYYQWDENELLKLKERGIEIEVFLGAKDKIINAKKAKDFFSSIATVYWINNSGHIL